jgi:hypothetical protein
MGGTIRVAKGKKHDSTEPDILSALPVSLFIIFFVKEHLEFEPKKYYYDTVSKAGI